VEHKVGSVEEAKALRKAKAMVEEELSKLTGGLPLPPGFKLPGF